MLTIQPSCFREELEVASRKPLHSWIRRICQKPQIQGGASRATDVEEPLTSREKVGAFQGNSGGIEGRVLKQGPWTGTQRRRWTCRFPQLSLGTRGEVQTSRVKKAKNCEFQTEAEGQA